MTKKQYHNQYRENCSLKLIEDLVGFFKPTKRGMWRLKKVA